MAGGDVPCDRPVSTKGGRAGVEECLNEGGPDNEKILDWLLGTGSRFGGVIQCTVTLGHSFPVQQSIHSLSVSVESRNTEK